jgi:excisionase family DNA binding protein
MGADPGNVHATRALRLGEPPVLEVRTLGPGEATGFVSIDGAALYLGMGRRFVEELIAKRELPSFKFGRSRRIRLSDLEEWAARHEEV